MKKTDGVKEARVSYEKGEAWIKYDDRMITIDKLFEVINGTGYKAVGVKTAKKTASISGKRRSP